jgi:N-acetylneuraminic acid mutarotase
MHARHATFVRTGAGLPVTLVVASILQVLALTVWATVPAAGATDGLWKPTALSGAPTATLGHTAVWTGSKMIVWGGNDEIAGITDTGGIYDPGTDTWTPTSTVGAPTRGSHTAVWTGSKMVVWGGWDGAAYLGTGAVFDPATNTWTPMSTVGAPTARGSHTAVWTGSKMIVWGGFTGPTATATNTGGIYDPVTNTWTPTTTIGAPSEREGHTAVWTGSKMIVWGGFGVQGYASTGGIYDPGTDTWAPTSIVGAPTPGYRRAVWTGSKMIVWGGWDGAAYLDTGAIFDPVTNTWTPTSTVGAPTARDYFTPLWTGSRMIVWGGWEAQGSTNTGGLYDPVSDTWAATSTVGAPTARGSHTAVWTGRKMIVWGGWDATGQRTNTGGIYNPTPAVGTDFNGDGYSDLLWHDQVTGSLYTWLLQGTVTTAGSYLTPSRFADTSWQIRGLTDFDGDGEIDVLWHHQTGGDLYVWLLDGTVTIAGTYLTPSRFADTDWQIRGVADLNGDGKADLLWHNQATGELYVWFMNGTVVTGGSYLTPSRFADTQWQIRGVADFNHDGRPDILWHHQGNGDLYVWGMTGTVVTWGSYPTPSRFADTRWKIVKVADFDKDGNQDLLWHHQGAGDLYVWFLNGTVVTGGSYLTPSRFSDTNWKVVPR